MKYYIYISDAKVDMLLAQIPHDVKKKVATKFGFDLKILKAERTAESETDANRIERLDTVISFIREYGKVGSADEPSDYINDTLSLSATDMNTSDERDYGFGVYFAGQTERTSLGLAGSGKHMIGNTQSSGLTGASVSALAGISTWFKNVERDDRLGNGEPEWIKSIFDRRGHLSAFAYVISGVSFMAESVREPSQQLEFFAKKLLFYHNPQEYTKQVLLGTPLYIAMTD